MSYNYGAPPPNVNQPHPGWQGSPPPKPPFYKQWWFIAAIAIFAVVDVAIVAAVVSNSDTSVVAADPNTVPAPSPQNDATTSSAPETTEESEESSAEPPYTPPPPSPTPESGLTTTSIGQVRGLQDRSGTQFMTFTVDSIAVNPGCNGSYPDPPANGQFVIVAVTINVLTTVDGLGLYFNDRDWHVIGPNGVRDNDNSTFEAYLCPADNEQFPAGPMGPGVYVGLVVMDTPHVSGQLIWTPGELGGIDGWSWAF